MWIRWIVFAVLCLGSWTPALSMAQERSLLDGEVPTMTRERHAERLYEGDVYFLQGDYYRAITAYQTYLLFAVEDPERERVRLKIAWMYALSERPEAALTELRTIVSERGLADPLSLWSLLYAGDMLLEAERPRQALKIYGTLIGTCQQLTEQRVEQAKLCKELTARAHLGQARAYGASHEFELAVEVIERLPSDSPMAPKAQQVGAYVANLEVPSKSPALAGILSIVPGLGHVYLEEYSIAGVAMVWNGIFIYALVDSILGDKYGQAALIGLLEFVWYSGTIFGAVSGAHRFNRDAKRIVEEGMREDLDRIDGRRPWIERFPHQGYTPKLQLEFSF